MLHALNRYRNSGRHIHSVFEHHRRFVGWLASDLTCEPNFLAAEILDTSGYFLKGIYQTWHVSVQYTCHRHDYVQIVSKPRCSDLEPLLTRINKYFHPLAVSNTRFP